MSPKQWQRQMKKGLLAKFDKDDDILNALLPEENGTCTNFTLHIMEQASKMNFVLGDVDNHRIAWAEDGTLVDSSAKELLQLVDGDIVRHNNMKFLWRKTGDEPNSISFEKNDDPLEPVENGLTKKEGVKRAFTQSIVNDTLIAFFRFREDDTNQFDGMVKWKKGSPTIIWTEDDDHGRTTWTANFGPGTPETASMATKSLLFWGENQIRAQQWELVAPFILHELWPALREVFGEPICHTQYTPI